MLNHALAPIAARQIQIDVGPLPALLRQEPFEQEIHADRIDGRDAEAVAHGAVGRAPASLHEDVVLPAEIHDVPDDEKVAGEIELLDEIELAGHLRAGAIVIRLVAVARAEVGNLPEKRRLRFTLRHGVIGKPIAEIRHRVLQPRGEVGGALDRAGHVGEQRRHLGRRLEIPFGVRRQPAARMQQIRVVVNAREDVEQRPPIGRREADAAGGHDGNVKRRRQIGQRPVVRILAAPAVALQLDIKLFAAEHADQSIDKAAHAVPVQTERGAAGERDESAGMAVQIVQRQRPFAFWRAQLHARDQPAEVAIALLGFAEDGKGEGSPSCLPRFPRPGDRELRPDDRPQPGRERGFVKTRGAVHPVAIEQRERGIAERGGALDERFRQRRRLEKTERGRHVKLDVHECGRGGDGELVI